MSNKKFTQTSSLKWFTPFCLFLIYFMCLLQKAQAQDGAINDNYSTGESYNWIAATAGSTGQIVNGRFVITSALQTNGKYRGDFQKSGGATLHAGNFPIIAIKMNKPPRCNWFFDTNLGSYNNSNNNSTKIVTDQGNVYYWDISTGRLGTTMLSTTQSTTLSLFQFKIADIEFSSTEKAAGDYSYEIDWVRTFRSVDELRTYLNPSGTTNPLFEFTGAFSHPGLLHNSADLARIKDLVTRQVTRPYKSYQLLLQSSRSSSTYAKAGPFKYLTRDASLTIATPSGTASGGAVKNGVENDFLAAYYNALMWTITGNEAHAQKSIEIIDAYTAFTVGITGADAELNGLYGFMLANAAELMRSTYPAWAPEKVQQCKAMLQNVFYPTLQNFRPCAHGNWDIICMKALLAIAVFTDDHAMFNKVVNYFYYGEGNGSIKNYVLTDAGQLQESNRDQPHTMLALGSLAELAEVALKQGVDLYAADNNAILRGYEYTARFNLGYDVPYQTSYDFCEKNYTDYTPESISSNGRGQFRAVFEIAYNHYVSRKNKAMPFSLEALATVLNPEGAPFGADNPGYGSLFFYLSSQSDYSFVPGSNGSNSVGLINDNFNGVADGWAAATGGSTAVLGAEGITVNMARQTNGTYRGDFKRSSGAILHAGNYPILAIKLNKPAIVNLTFDTNLGAYGNGANKWTGKVGSDIYYYDLTKGFGAAPTFLSTTGQTSLSTFQFKVADVSSGEMSYTVDWVKTFKNVNELLAYDPNTGLVNDNFTTGTDGWVSVTTGATAATENGHLRVILAKQSNNTHRGDIRKTAGATLYPANYPIVAVKLKKPEVVNLTFDTNLGAFGNGSNRQTGKVGESIYYFDLTKTGFGASNTLLTNPTALTLFQFKIADITSGETSYQVDWVKTVKSVEELQNLVVPMYQTISFPEIGERKVGDTDFSPATTTSGLPINYSSTNTSVATIVNGLIRVVGAGSTEITASQPGNDNYYPADLVKQTFSAYIPPLVKTKNISIVVDENGVASIAPQQIDNGSESYSGDLTLGLDRINFTCGDIGSPITVTLTATDGNGHSSSATAQVSVTDDKQPILVAPSGQLFCFSSTGYQVPELKASDNCGIANVLYEVSGVTSRIGTGKNASGDFNVGQSTITWRVTDAYGNENVTSTIVDVNTPFSATIPDVYALNPQTDEKNTLYLGYGPSSLTVATSPSGGKAPYVYHWNTGAVTQSISVSIPGLYSVSVTDALGCVTTASIVIKELDVRCGNNNDKVMVCHNGESICVASSAVQAHLNHGDKAGSCDFVTVARVMPHEKAMPELKLSDIVLYPNPVKNKLTIQVGELLPGAHLELYDTRGALLYAQAFTKLTETLPVQHLPAGLYYLKLTNGRMQETKKFIKTND